MSCCLAPFAPTRSNLAELDYTYLSISMVAGLDLRGVAKAAVAGDEQALDMFSNLDMFGWRPKTAGRRPLVYPPEFRDGMAFFAATHSGTPIYTIRLICT